MFVNRSFILASKSTSRAKILKNTGLNFHQTAPRINETTVKKKNENKRINTKQLALVLAKAKGESIKKKDTFVLGCDTIIDFKGKPINKANNFKDATKKLQKLSGKSHKIHSAAVVYYNNKLVWKKTQSAKITIRKLSEKEIKQYLSGCGKQILNSVGCYQIEAEGPKIIEKTEGDFFCIMGLPLFPFLNFLKKFKSQERTKKI